jgi:hypothetical protein
MVDPVLIETTEGIFEIWSTTLGAKKASLLD